MRAAYHDYLRAKAEATPPMERQRLFALLGLLWLAPPTLAALISGALGVPRQTQIAVVLPVFALAMAGYIHAAAKIVAYGSKSDRRPPAWADTPNGRALFETLHRWSLRGFADLAPETRLAADLKLTQREVSGVLADLAANLGLETLPLQQAHDPTARDILDAMDQAPPRQAAS